MDRSATSPSHRLVGEDSRHTSHNNVQGSTYVNRHGRRRIGTSGNTSTDDAHDSIQTNGNAVAGATVG